MVEDKSMQVRPIDRLKDAINSPRVQEQLRNAINKNAPLFAASVLELFAGDKMLQQCDPGSIIIESMKSAVLKLPISKVLGFSYIIAYNESVKEGNGWKKVMTPHFQLGYKGLIQLAKRSGMYRCINADYIYSGETVNKDRFTGELFIAGEKDSEKVTGYFAYFEETNGFRKWAYRDKKEAETHASKYSQTFKYKTGAWKTEPDKMHLKGVLRDLLTKWGTLSIDVVHAVSDDISGDSTIQEAEARYVDTVNISHDAEETIECPQSDGSHIFTRVCEKCGNRKGCPAWAEADESEQKPDAPNMGTPPPNFI